MTRGRSPATAVGALLALAVAAFAYVTTETLPIGLLLLITADLDVSPSTAGLLVTYYGLVVVVASIPLTHLTRRVPRRLLLSGVLAVFVLTSWVSAAASSYGMLLAARVVTALSQALFWSVVVPTAAGLYPPRVRGRVIAACGRHPALRRAAASPLCLLPRPEPGSVPRPCVVQQGQIEGHGLAGDPARLGRVLLRQHRLLGRQQRPGADHVIRWGQPLLRSRHSSTPRVLLWYPSCGWSSVYRVGWT
jgi:hypothetical protein